MLSTSHDINTANWAYCQYQNGDLRAFVSLGGKPVPDGQVAVVYYVTTSNKEHQEVYQTEHGNLAEAVETLKKRYGHWKLVDMRLAHKEGGCGTCSAH